MNNDVSKIIGTWRTRKGCHITFKQDGTFEATIFRDKTPGTYKFVDGGGIVTSTGYVLNIVSLKSSRMVVNGGDGEFVLTRKSGIGIIPLVIAVVVLAVLFGDGGRTEGFAQIVQAIVGIAMLVLIGLIIYKIIRMVIGRFV